MDQGGAYQKGTCFLFCFVLDFLGRLSFMCMFVSLCEFMCVWEREPVWVCIHPMCAGAHGGREVIRSPKFGLSHTVVSHWMWVLGIKLRAPARSASTLNCPVISPATESVFWKEFLSLTHESVCIYLCKYECNACWGRGRRGFCISWIWKHLLRSFVR